ncbi:MAG: hypothetical protein NTX12_08750 [Actinobacteria bacterium]|nr:hypothetical protein [Actinomycetota bacterium]
MVTMVGSVVRLEPLAVHHIQGLFEALGKDDEAWRWMLVATPQVVIDIATIVNGYISDRESGTREPFAVIEVKTGRVVGTTSFMDISKKDRSLEIGTLLKIENAFASPLRRTFSTPDPKKRSCALELHSKENFDRIEFEPTGR